MCRPCCFQYQNAQAPNETERVNKRWRCQLIIFFLSNYDFFDREKSKHLFGGTRLFFALGLVSGVSIETQRSRVGLRRHHIWWRRMENAAKLLFPGQKTWKSAENQVRGQVWHGGGGTTETTCAPCLRHGLVLLRSFSFTTYDRGCQTALDFPDKY